MIQVVAGLGIVVRWVDANAMENRIGSLETTWKRLRTLQSEEGLQKLRRKIGQTAQIQQAHLDVSLIGEHVVVIGAARRHVESGADVALNGKQNVL